MPAIALPAAAAGDTQAPAAQISCAVCQHEIPLTTAAARQVSDYVEYFCGLDCYERWRNQTANP
jgi:hypothetical protein